MKKQDKLVPVKITVRRHPEGGALYPVGYKANLIDSVGIGPHYGWKDHALTLGGGAETEELVTAIPLWYFNQFKLEAEQAEEGHLLQVLDEDEAEQFFADHVDEEEVEIDEKRILLINTKLLAGMELSQEDKDALDENHPSKGVKKNPRKGFKAKLGGRVCQTKAELTKLK